MTATADGQVPADERWVIAGFTKCRDLAYLTISYGLDFKMQVSLGFGLADASTYTDRAKAVRTLRHVHKLNPSLDAHLERIVSLNYTEPDIEPSDPGGHTCE